MTSRDGSPRPVRDDPSLVVVLHRSARVLPGLLAALPTCELVVVDTGPDDGGRALLPDDARLLVLPGAGFGAANNAALEHVTREVTVLLNPDTVPRPGALEALRAFAIEHDALHVPRLLNADGSVQDSAHAQPGRVRLRRGRPWRSDHERTVGWAIAACLAARTSTLRALGPFDPEPQLFYEDLDLCLRARVPTVLHPSAEVVHLGGHSTGDLDRLAIEARRRREVVGARLGRRALLLDDLGQAVELGLRAPVRPRARAQLRALREARRRRG